MAQRRDHRQRIETKTTGGVLATCSVSFWCPQCRRDHIHRMRIFGQPDQIELDRPARLLGRWMRTEKRARKERAKLARRLGTAAEPADPLPPLSLAELRRLAKPKRRKAS